MIKNENRLIRFDWAIKNIFKKGKSLDVLEGFLSDLLQKNITSIQLCDSESTKDHADDKSNRVDVHVTTKEGEKIIIEVQSYSEWDYFSRILYGTSKTITTHMHQGISYREVPNVISISICYFGVGSGKDYIYKGSTNFVGQHFGDILDLNDAEKEQYLGKAKNLSQIYPTYYIIKVDKFKEVVQDIIDEWIYFFKTEKIKEDFRSKSIRVAAKHLNYLKLSKDDRKEYDIFQENLMLEKSLAESKEAEFRVMTRQIEKDAEEKGMKKGIEKGKSEVAKKLLIHGMSVEEVAKLTELTIDVVKSLEGDDKKQ